MKKSNSQRVTWKNLKKDKYLVLMVIPCVAYFVIFHYIPIFWNVIAFENYSARKGIFGSEWVGFENFIRFFKSPYAFRVIRNTLVINLMDLIIGFPVPIIFALLLNEVRSNKAKKIIQTFSYLPHFISMAVVVGMLKIFLSPTNGIVNNVIVMLGGKPINFFMEQGCFRWMYVLSNIWQNFGWDSIIYFAAIAGISYDQYEAAMVDGAGRWKRMFHITIPELMPTIIILLIMKVGWLLSIGFEKILLMYNEATYEVADVISTYVYRASLLRSDFSYGTAIGLFNSAISLILVLTVNHISKKVSEISLF